MADTIITTTNKPRRAMYSRLSEPSSINSVRAFRIDPETAHLQIRLEKDYVTVALTPNEAHRLIDALLDAIPDLKPLPAEELLQIVT